MIIQNWHHAAGEAAFELWWGSVSLSWVFQSATAMDCPRAIAQQVVAQLEPTGKYFHCQQVACGKAPHVGEGVAKIGGKAVDDLGSQGGFLLALKDDFSGMPIGFDNDGVGCQNGTRWRGETSVLAGSTACGATADFEQRRRIQL